MNATIFAGNPFDLAIGGLEALIAIVLTLNLRRAQQTTPVQAVLVAFFALRAAERLSAGLTGGDVGSLSVAIDVVAAATLCVLVFTLTRVFAALERRARSARGREREYERALADYRRLARHRIANPVAAIVGSAQALHELRNLDESTRRRLLEAILAEAKRLEAVSLDPRASLNPEERNLRPAPNRAAGERDV